jgi:hypothetical protein
MASSWRQHVQGNPYATELVTSLRRWRSRFSPKVSPQVYSAYWLIASIGLGMTMLIIGAIFCGRVSTPPIVSFADYTEIRPGDHKNALKYLPSTCYREFEPYSHTETCKIRTLVGTFSHVEARIYNDKIQELDFIVKENALRVGDLILLLGNPTEVYSFHNAIHFIWYNWHWVIGVRIPNARNASPLLPVSKIYFLVPMPPPVYDHDD